MALSAGFDELYLKLRHKYMSGMGEVVITPAGIAKHTDGDVRDEDVAVGAKGTVLTTAIAGSDEIVLGSASEAAQFRVGDAVRVLTTAGADVTVHNTVNPTIKFIKGQKLVLIGTNTAGFAADVVQGSLVVRFETGGRDGMPDSVTDHSAGLQYLGMGEMAAFLNQLQAEVSPTVEPVATATVADTTLGTYSKVTGTLDNVVADYHLNDLIVFKQSGNDVDGVTARVVDHTAGDNADFIINDIRDSSGNFLGNQFPVTIGANTAVAPTDTTTTFKIRAGVCDPYITAMMGADFPTSGVGTTTGGGGSSNGLAENSNTPGAVTLFLNGLWDFVNRYDYGDAGEYIPMDTEEDLLGHMIGYHTAQGVRVRVAEDAANEATTVVVEKDNAINDIPFPLSGTLRILTNVGVGNNQGTAGVTPLPTTGTYSFTREKRSGSLTIAAGVGGAVPTGSIVELAPTHGQIMKGYSSNVSGPSILEIMERTRLVALDYKDNAMPATLVE